MQQFTDLYFELDASNRTTAKLAALRSYFGAAPDADAAWAVYFLIGGRLKRTVASKEFREWAGRACGYPEWMVEECYDHVGDLAETLALLLGNRRTPDSAPEAASISLGDFVEQRILPLREMEADDKEAALCGFWSSLDARQCLVLNKLITGGFRVGVSRTLVTRALAEVAGVEVAVMAHRLMGDWQPSAANYRSLLLSADAGSEDPARPYPFCLAYPLEASAAGPGDLLGSIEDWQIEWKWDGIRAQLIKRGAEVLLWSRGEEMIGEAFPEIVEAAARWDGDAVLDGEILVWDNEADKPGSFAQLQRRLGRKRAGPKLRREVPVVFMAYDCMELAGSDCRRESTAERRQHLEGFCGRNGSALLRSSPLVECPDWTSLVEVRTTSRERRVEGLMLKRRSAPYGAGRKKGDWWKWKVEPYSVDAVLVYAQQGHGRRAGLYTDYTFSVWDGEALVPFAKAYSGLSDSEIRRVDRWIRQHTREKHGPVRVVDPELVFEIAFEGIGESKRHKSGIAVRFPRISRWREDKPASEADSLETIRALL